MASRLRSRPRLLPLTRQLFPASPPALSTTTASGPGTPPATSPSPPTIFSPLPLLLHRPLLHHPQPHPLPHPPRKGEGIMREQVAAAVLLRLPHLKARLSRCVPILQER